jgi:hypothetical protein
VFHAFWPAAERFGFQDLRGVTVRWKICVVVLSVALFASGCSKGKPTDELIEGLNSSEQGDRIQAVRMLPHRKQEAGKVVPALIDSLKDKNADVRWNAAVGLGHFGAEARDAIPALEEAQRDKDSRVREGARVAISRIKG